MHSVMGAFSRKLLSYKKQGTGWYECVIKRQLSSTDIECGKQVLPAKMKWDWAVKGRFRFMIDFNCVPHGICRPEEE